jgi:hypothetical protein
VMTRGNGVGECMQKSRQSDVVAWENKRRSGDGQRLWHGKMHAEELAIKGGSLGE